MSAEIVATQSMTPALLDDQDASLKHYEQSWALGTVRAYRSDWEDWKKYCQDRGACPVPADPLVVAAFLSALAGGKWGTKKALSTIERRTAAIRHLHIESGHGNPTADPRVGRVLRGIRRQLTKKQDRKAPVRTEDIKKMIQALGNDPRSLRDKALIAIGFATGSRRSELAALKVEDLRSHRDGLIVEVRKSKSDQEGEGLIKLVRMGSSPSTCPVTLLDRWLAIAGIESGHVFRSISNDLTVNDQPISSRGIARAVKRAAKMIGLNPEHFSGHSLRAGYVTEADARGAKATDVMAQTGHKSLAMIRIYTRYNVEETFHSSTALDLGF